MTKIIISTILSVIAWIVVCSMLYISFAAISADFNIADWHENYRKGFGTGCSVAIFFVCVLFGAIYNHLSKNYKL